MDSLSSSTKKANFSVFSGQNAEMLARKFLEKQGLHFRENNYRFKGGEIDLIMQDENCCVFVEVRLRQNLKLGSGLESINAQKKQRIIKSALHYLQKKQLIDRMDCRFDVVSIDGGKTNWIKNAFWA